MPFGPETKTIKQKLAEEQKKREEYMCFGIYYTHPQRTQETVQSLSGTERLAYLRRQCHHASYRIVKFRLEPYLNGYSDLENDARMRAQIGGCNPECPNCRKLLKASDVSIENCKQALARRVDELKAQREAAIPSVVTQAILDTSNGSAGEVQSESETANDS